MGLKKVILFALVIMSIGTALELYLLDHYEDKLQLIPILCIGLVIVTVILLIYLRSKVMKGLFKFILVITALSGFYGSYLHLIANYEFEQEMKPTASTMHLLSESLSGALPALAPFSMVVLALIGYSYLIIINQNK